MTVPRLPGAVLDSLTVEGLIAYASDLAAELHRVSILIGDRWPGQAERPERVPHQTADCWCGQRSHGFAETARLNQAIGRHMPGACWCGMNHSIKGAEALTRADSAPSQQPRQV